MKTKKVTPCKECDAREKEIFCGLTGSGLDLLDETKTTQIYKKKQLVYTQGHPSFGVYCIQSGLVKIYKSGIDGKQYISHLADAGTVLGLSTLFTQTPHLWSAEVIEPAVICFIPREAVIQSIRRNPQVAIKVIETLSRDLEESESERVELAQGSVRERLARLLSILAESHGIPHKEGIRINLSLSREEMAEMVGTAAETAMRLLKDFREENLVEVHGRDIIVLNKKRLIEVANISE